MAVFEYEIVQKNGKSKKGRIEAENADRVTSALRASGNIIISVKEQSALNKDINLPMFNKIKTKDLAIFCRQFRSILHAGITIVEALDMLCLETEHKTLKKAIKDVQNAVETGETLAGAMALQGDTFPPIMINMIQAGEASGSLEIALDRMAKQFDKESKLKSMVKGAMIYPIVVCVVAIGVIIIMMTKVVPNFKAMFDDMNMDLPAPTKIIMNMSDFFVEKWYILAIIIASIVVVIIAFKNSDGGKNFLAKLAIKAPVFGNLTMKSSCAKFSRTMSTLMASGISMMDAIDITAKTIGNKIIHDIIMNAKEDVARGLPLSEPLTKAEILPPRLCHMTKIGEDTGNLEQMLDSLADYYEDEVEAATKGLTAMMEPLIIILLAVIVGGIIVAIMSPMLEIYGNIGNA
ncbi:MAG: type II secretion system F family protein [Clostridiales bacterium]|nr:type II secretion system F family protein [Clostridiales bacterium]